MAIGDIGKDDLPDRSVDRTLRYMGQHADIAETIDRISGSTQAASRAIRYSRTAVALHWAIAVLVVATIPIGWYGATFKIDLAQSATNAHKSIGILIRALPLVRVRWRLRHRPPPLPGDTALWLRCSARGTHILFYVLLLVLPLSGWWMCSAVPVRHAFGFGPVLIPFLPVPRGWASAGPAHFAHVNLAWLMVGLAVLNILAALKHRFVDHDDIPARMLPRRSRFQSIATRLRGKNVRDRP